MKIALILSTAFVTTKPDFPARERRIRQYLNGLGQIAEVSAQYPVFDVYSVDNTVEDPATLEIQIVEALHRIRGFRSSVHFFDNDLGQSNRGSGVMVQWMRILPDLVGKYEYVVHYEPRQHLVNYSFFERVAKQPDNYFCMYRDLEKLYGIPVTVPRFWTGLFSMRVADLLGYVRATDRLVAPTVQLHPRWWSFYRHLRWRLLPLWAAWLDEAIETDFPLYVRRHRIPIVRVSDLGALWHQESRDRMVKMIDCDFRNDEVIA